MPHFIVWGVTDQVPLYLKTLIIQAAKSVKELGLKEQDILLTVPTIFPQVQSGEIMVQVSELWDKPERTPEVRNKLAEAVGLAIQPLFKFDVIAVRLDPPFDPKAHGFWTSRT